MGAENFGFGKVVFMVGNSLIIYHRTTQCRNDYVLCSISNPKDFSPVASILQVGIELNLLCNVFSPT